jgi:hypothetical protein
VSACWKGETSKIGRPTIWTSHRSVRTGEPTALRRGLARLWSAAHSVYAYDGRKSRWYEAATRQNAGRTTAAGATEEVNSEPIVARAALDGEAPPIDPIEERISVN